jgi:hypothetical protein
MGTGTESGGGHRVRSAIWISLAKPALEPHRAPGEIGEIPTNVQAGSRVFPIVDPGGVDETRQALRSDAGLTLAVADSVTFVDLATITNPDLVLP